MFDNSEPPAIQTDPTFLGRDPGFLGNNEPKSSGRRTIRHRRMIVIVPN